MSLARDLTVFLVEGAYAKHQVFWSRGQRSLSLARADLAIISWKIASHHLQPYSMRHARAWQNQARAFRGRLCGAGLLLQDVPHVQLWTHGRETHVPYVKRGGILILHFESDPFTAFHSPFDLMNVYFSKATLDELAEGAGGRKSAGLRRPDYGVPDQMLYHLAASVLPFFHRSAASDQMILDHIALAFHARLASEYSGAPVDVRLSQGGLAPWQARRAKDFIEADLTRGPTLLEIADECGLSASHFSRAFRKTTGRPPHRWLLERRVDAAKGHLVDPDLALSDIAKLCGFSDPSHFSRVFSKSTGETPGSWRRGPAPLTTQL